MLLTCSSVGSCCCSADIAAPFGFQVDGVMGGKSSGKGTATQET